MSDEIETARTGATMNRYNSEQDVGTPRSFLDAVEKRFGVIHRDLAATQANAVTDLWYGPDQNSLSIPWASENPDGVLWLNPPFAKIGPWAEKCVAESRDRRGLILMLTPMSGAAWFTQTVHGNAYVLALETRLTFVGHKQAFPKDLVLSVFGMGLRGFDTWSWK